MLLISIANIGGTKALIESTALAMNDTSLVTKISVQQLKIVKKRAEKLVESVSCNYEYFTNSKIFVQ